MKENLRTIVSILLGFAFSIVASIAVIKWGDPPTRIIIASFILIILGILYLAGLFQMLWEWGWDWRRFRRPIALGILRDMNVVAERDPGLGRPHCGVPIAQWQEYSQLTLGNKRTFKVRPIAFRKINPRYGVIVNPFGELYLEENYPKMGTLRRIQEFLTKGGIFVCTGGIPFYYRWITDTQTRVDTTPISMTMLLGNQPGLLRDRFFEDTLVTTEFQLRFSALPDVETLMPTHQQMEDRRKFGDLSQVGGTNQVLVFRPVLPGANVIPVLRATVNGMEVYPLAAVSYGRGYLLVSGMHVTYTEFQKINSALETFCLMRLSV